MLEQHITPVTLEDDRVIIAPMTRQHIDGLFQAGQFASIWEWTTQPYCLTLASTRTWVEQSLLMAKTGALLPFVIIDKSTQKIVGSTSYLNIMLMHKAIEIGFTFLTPSAQKSDINRRCKYLLMCHGFDTLHVNRIAFQTHEKNTSSRNAILGIGATYEGIHRNCRIQHNGSIRSSAFYSVIKPQWSSVKRALINKLNKEY